MERILQDLLCPDTTKIKQAEQLLEQHKQNHFAQCFQELIQGLQVPGTQELSALLLQQKFLNNPKDLKQLDQAAMLSLVQSCHALFKPEFKLLFLKRLSEIVVKVCAFLEKNNDIVQFIKLLNDTKEEKLTLAQLYLIEIVCEFSFDDDLLMEHKQTLTQIFEKNLVNSQPQTSQQIQVKVACMRTLCCFLVTISNEDFLKSFANVFPVLLQVSIEAIKEDEEVGRVSLESLSELVEVHPKFVKPFFQQLLQLVTEVLMAAQIDSSTKGSALDILVQLGIHLPQMMRKSDYFKKNTLQTMFKMVVDCDLDESLSSWLSELQDQQISKNDEGSQALDAFSRLTPELGAKFLIPACFQYIKQAVQAPQASYQYAAVMILSQICVECKDDFQKELTGMLDMLFALKPETHVKLAYGILTCLAILCEEFAPEIQQNHHQRILSFLIPFLDAKEKKIQLRAVSCLLNFIRALADSEDEEEYVFMAPYYGPVLEKISQLFNQAQSNYPLLQEVLLCLSQIADLMKGDFAQYYNNFMPGLKSLLNTIPATTPQQVELRVLVIECLGSLLTAVQNNENLIQDQQVILKSLIAIHNDEKLEKDDPHHAAILTVFSQLVVQMKENFSQYLPYIFDKVLAAADIAVDFCFGDHVEVDNNKMIAKTFDLKLFGGKKTVALNAHAIEQKVTGSATLLAIITHMKRAFLPYIERALPVILKNIVYKHSKQIRQDSVKAMPFLLLSCENEAQMTHIVQQALSPMIQELKLSHTPDDIYLVLENLYDFLKFMKSPMADIKVMESLIEALEGAMDLQNQLKEQQVKKVKDDLDDMDDQQREDFEEDYEEVNDIMQIAKDVLEEVLKKYNVLEQRIGQKIGVMFMNVFKKKFASQKEKIYALCFFDYLLEFCTDNLFNQALLMILPQFHSFFKSMEDPEMNQAIAYGLGVVYQRKHQNPQLENCLNEQKHYLLSLVNLQNAATEEFKESTDVALNAVGKLALFQNQPDVLNLFISKLPLKSESEEAQACHKMVVQQIKVQNPVFSNVDQNVLNQALQRIKEFDLRNPKSEILDDETKSLLQNL